MILFQTCCMYNNDLKLCKKKEGIFKQVSTVRDKELKQSPCIFLLFLLLLLLLLLLCEKWYNKIWEL